MYYNTEKNRNYVYWFGQWNEIPTYENNPIIWKGKLNQAPENPEKIGCTFQGMILFSFIME